MRRKLVWLVLALLVIVYLNNSSLLAGAREGRPTLLAHRGVAQTFPMDGLTSDTCTAERIFPPEHEYLENTIPSIAAAFAAGADVVELDIHPTTDGEFAVFHDWTVDCRTDGQGVTRELTLAELQGLDIGYGYTADSGQTFPFRGKGSGMMPSLDEVLASFPAQSLLIHIKSNDPEEGVQLANYLSTVPEAQLERLAVYGGDEPIRTLRERLPEVRVMSVATMKACLMPYLALGWTGYVPAACDHTQLHLPEEVAPWLWGWPNRFVQRMAANETRVILVAGDGGFSEGFDTVEDLERLPDGYQGGIWTNRIERIGPVILGQGNLEK
jgi:glycerophosphoryl diester phosphodiesterase